MKLAIYQTISTQGDIDAALSTIERVLLAAAQLGVKMVVFPELYLPGYNQTELQQRMAQTTGESWEQAFSELTKKAGCGLTIGWAEREQNTLYNSASAFDGNGQKLAHYRKIQLYGPVENATFSPGEHYCTFDFEGLRCAILICYDVEFAAHVHALSKQGVELLLVPTANANKFHFIPNLLVPARATEENLTIAYANFCGHEGDAYYGGRSIIAAPCATVLAQAGQGESLLVADLSDVKNIDRSLYSTQMQDFRKID